MEPYLCDEQTTSGRAYSPAMTHRTAAELEQGLDVVRKAPRDAGDVRLIVRRPAENEREILEEGRLDTEHGLVGDGWEQHRGHDGEPAWYAQVTVMNARYAELISGSPESADWAPAGDQLYVDLDISEANLPAGTRLSIGEAVIEMSPQPHTGCAKFSSRFGSDAWKLANSELGRSLRLRGANARVVQSGIVRTGDTARKV